jgi:hypothetical protein
MENPLGRIGKSAWLKWKMRSLKLNESALLKLKNPLSKNEKSDRYKWKIRSIIKENTLPKFGKIRSVKLKNQLG